METTVLTLPEYEDNPFIAKLPPLYSSRDFYQRLRVPAVFDDKERHYPPHLRRHCLMRLGRYFEPMPHHLELAQRFDTVLRQGYVGRNPVNGHFVRHLQDGADRIANRQLLLSPAQGINTATSFSIVGCSGIGKSRAIERVLSLYPQVVEHTEPFSLHQLTWLKLDCPRQGSTKQLCQNFFGEVDRILGTRYLVQHGKARIGVDHMMLHMSQVANLHGLGALVIDEIQHLIRGRGNDPEDLLNFLVTLVNTIGVPVLVIGTLAAVKVLQGNFREARRASGMGSLIWDRFPRDAGWEHFAKRMWAYQWLNEETPLTDELMAVLYDESQGVVDVLIKLYMLTQARLMQISEVRRQPERIDAGLLRDVARREFRLIQPMIHALRINDRKALAVYDDLQPFQFHVEKILTGTTTPPVPSLSPAAESGANHSLEQQVLAAMASLGIATDVSAVLLQEAIAAAPSKDPFDVLAVISARLKGQKQDLNALSPKTSRKIRKPKTDSMDEKDLRHIIKSADSLTGYDALLGAGVIKNPLSDCAA